MYTSQADFCFCQSNHLNCVSSAVYDYACAVYALTKDSVQYKKRKTIFFIEQDMFNTSSSRISYSLHH